jgi:hypothetical protein
MVDAAVVAGPVCPSCSKSLEHSDWCPRLGLDVELNPRMSDDEVRALGYERPDDRGYWQKPSRKVCNALPTSAERRCLSCGVDPHEGDHGYWCPDATPRDPIAEALRDARDLEAAIAWQPKVTVPKLSEPERVQLNILFAALVHAREQAYPPPKLWTLAEYRDIARDRKGTA